MIEETEKKVKAIDSLLTTVKSVLKKHWGILIIIGICALGYWIWNLPEDTAVKFPQEQTESTTDSTMYSEDSVDTVYYQEEDTTTVTDTEEE